MYGAVHKVRHAIFGQFDPPVTLCHTSRAPPKERHTSRRPPPHFSRPSTKILYKFYLNCSRRFLYGEVLSGGPLSGRFCPGWFLSVPLSATIHLLQQKVKHHFKFHVSCV